MVHEISLNEIYRLKNTVFIDVRSENEYQEGTIPGAYNIPLFNNEERAKIGAIYTQESPKKAAEIGLQVVSSKLPSLYKQVEMLAGKDPVMLFCWRGGMRSKSVAVILDLMGLSVYRLHGGYKAYRRSIVEFFSKEFPFHVVVLKGNTGTGKTEVLKQLKAEGYPVIDLEGLSNNRGSVFGHIGLGAQPTQKQFESLLYREITNYVHFVYILVECESKRIGRVTIPHSVYSAMQEGTQILIHDSLGHRAERLVKEYTQMVERDIDLRNALERLKKRIGKASLAGLLDMLDKNDYEGFAGKLILEYYDPLYGYPNEDNDSFDFCISNHSFEDALSNLRGFLDNKFNLGTLPLK
ncbi:MAG: tRNA 2-selenouridine synthase [Candidatus Dichloromethanomonas elyunquensis]|nr:MAG: tRNA 2-selenouridine synthase [Candidatus Dichloromethanomonas elyunquensis]